MAGELKPERLDPSQAVLVVVDLQEKLVPAIDRSELVLANSILLMRLASVLDLPVVLTTQYAKGLGPTLPAVLEVAPGVEPLDKLSFGCFGDEGFARRIDDLERRQLLVAGVESHICVTQTVLGALDAGHSVHVMSDAIGSRVASNHRIGLSRMERAGALLSSAEMATYELLGRSDGAAFKKMLPHLRG